MRKMTRTVYACAVVLWSLHSGAAAAWAQAKRPPNVIIIYADDPGYADLGCFSAKKIQTPHLDRMARQGTRFTSFYVAQAVCSASRATCPAIAQQLGISDKTVANALKSQGAFTRLRAKPRDLTDERYGRLVLVKTLNARRCV